VAAAALASGYELRQAVEFANAAAGLVIEKLGTAAISVAELNQSLVPMTPAARRMVRSDAIAGVVRAARASGRLALFLGVEGSYAIDDDVAGGVARLAEAGVKPVPHLGEILVKRGVLSAAPSAGRRRLRTCRTSPGTACSC